jgi:UDP-N-acetylmuramoylalanine--D-glutamate ligase
MNIYKDKQSLPYNGKNIAVLGLGIEGKDAINYLLSVDAKVTLLDKKAESEIDFDGVDEVIHSHSAGIPSRLGSDKNKINVICGENYLSDLTKYDYLVRSPGVYRFLPEITEAEKNGVVVTSAIKIFFDECPGKIIGVTGTKGKGTTSTLIYEILKSDNRGVYLSGNIGKPYLELLPKLSKDNIVVMEMSSFQLIDLDVSPHIAVVLNITSDHMDWHKNQEEYVNAKKNIVRNQLASDFAIINFDYDVPKSFAGLTKAKVLSFTRESLESKFKKDLLLRGEHNWENIAAAVSVARILNISDETILKVIRNFRGLEHRLELVKTVNGVTFYNDSFATGPQPTIAAINSFTEPETIILGGSDKGLDYSELGEVISKTENLKNIILIGQIRNQIVDTFKGTTFKGNVYDLGTAFMSEIVKKAYIITPKGGVVILSPAAASFDMFKNYKDRGIQFKNAVNNLDV